MNFEILLGGESGTGLELRELDQVLERRLLPGVERAGAGEARDRELVTGGHAAEFGRAVQVTLRVAVVVLLADVELTFLGEFIETESCLGVASGLLGDQAGVFRALSVERGSEERCAEECGDGLFHDVPRRVNR